jgi:hypothetical protein
MTTRTKMAILATGGAAALAVLLLPSAPPEAPMEPSSRTIATLAPATPETPLATRPRWHPVRSWRGRYALTLDAELTRTADLGGDGQVRLSCAIATAPSEDGAWLTGRVTRLEVDATPALRPHFTPAADAGALDFALRLDADGAMVEDRYAQGMPTGLRNAIASLIEGLAPDGDPAGREARRSWRKPGGGGAPAGEGSATLVRDDLGLVRADYTYALEADVTLSPTHPMRQRVVTTMRLTRDLTAGDLTTPLADTPIDPATLVAERQRAAQHQPPRQVASGRTVLAILADSEAAHLARDQTRASALGDELVATLEQRAEGLPDLVAALREAGLDGHRLRALSTALVAARTPTARGALATLLGDASVPYLARHGLVSALTFAPELAPEVLAAALAVLDAPDDPVRVAAAHALAGQAQLLEKRRAPVAADLRADLLARATVSLGTPGHPDRGLWLSAVGNLGGVELWPLVAPFVVSQDERERLYAIEALRFVPLPAARLALAKAMRLDPAHANRRRAAEMALYHPQTAMQESVLRALREDPDPSVRLGAAHVVAVWGVTSPALNDAVARAAETERHPDVRRALAELRPVSLDDAGVTP